MIILPTLTELTHLSGFLQVLLSSAIAMAALVGASSSSLEGAEPPPKKARSRACLSMSSQYVCV
jgi:hypothetical protein